jgi:hypothetical protein
LLESLNVLLPSDVLICQTIDKTVGQVEGLLQGCRLSHHSFFLCLSFRNGLWKDLWLPDIEELKIPFTEGVDPLDILSTPSQQALWASEGLPADRVSTENAAVVVSCSRYPLLIDPQLQGIKWIRGKESDAGLQTITLT